MTLSCMRRIEFCYGHRLMNHPGKCATLHGHSGAVEVHATSMNQQGADQDGLDELGMVVDFGLIKAQVGGWIDSHWDHTMILCEQDHETVELVQQCPGRKPVFLLPDNPTAERLAHYLLWKVCPEVLRGNNVVAHKIVLWENANCFAEAVLDPCDPAVRTLYGE